MHDHTYLCGHAQLIKPQAYHIIAKQQNFAGFAFCCHNPFKNPETDKKHRMPYSRYQEFLLEFQKAKKYLSDNNVNLDLILSMEVDYLPQNVKETEEFVKETQDYDSLNGSLHYYDYFQQNIFNDPNQQKIDFMYKYQKEFIDMIDTQWFTVISHLDFIKTRVGIQWWKQHEDLWYKIFVQILDHLEQVNIQRQKQNQDMISIEINTGGNQYDPDELFMPCSRLITYITQNCHNIPLCLSSDAHDPVEVGRNFKEALQLLQKLGVTRLSYYKHKKIYYYSINDAINSLNYMSQDEKQKYLENNLDKSWIVPKEHIPYQTQLHPIQMQVEKEESK